MSPMPASLWAATARPAAHTPPLEGDVRADVCIVGGGFCGLSAALHLAEAGSAVRLLETEEPGFGASGRNGGQVIPGLKHDPDEVERDFGPELGRRFVTLAGGAADFTFALIERLGLDCSARQSGWIQAAASRRHLALAEDRVRQWRERGAAAELLNRERVSLLLGSDFYSGGWLDPRGGALQPLSYARELARAAQHRGAAINGASRVLAIGREGGAWRVRTGTGSVLADQVLICTNAYGGDLWHGLRRSLLAFQSFQVATKPLSENLRRSILPQGHVTSDTQRLLAYYRLDDEGRLVLGGKGGPNESDDLADYRHLTARLRRLFPQIGEPGWDFHWGGKVALTADHYPHLHELAPGVKAALGFNGRGVAMATRTGKEIADWARGKPASEIDIPVTSLSAIPLHGLQVPFLRALVKWMALRDWTDRRFG